MTETPSDPSRRALLCSLTRAIAGPTRFEPVPEVSGATRGVLWAAHAGGGQVVLAGDDGLVVHFDGERWRRQPLGTDLPIHALTQAEDGTTIAVGWLGLICERRDGVWQHVQGGKATRGSRDRDEIRSNLPLFDVTTGPDDEVWAVGDGGRVLRRDADGWQELQAPTDANLRCVLALPDGTVLAGGAGGCVLHFERGVWSSLETGTHCQIASLCARGDREVLAVGGEYERAVGGFVGRIFATDGAGWHPIERSRPLPRLRRIRSDGSAGFLIVGDGGFAARYSGCHLAQLQTATRQDLHDVVAPPGGPTLLCGDGGAVLAPSTRTETVAAPIETRAASAWTVVAEAEGAPRLRGLWADADDFAIAVGDEGTILHYENGAFVRRAAPTRARLHAVWGSSRRNLYACGEASTVLHFDGDSWRATYEGGLDVALLAITGFGPHDVLAVGDQGLALRYDGLHWQRTETGTRHELYDVWGLDGDHVLAVGGGGTVVRWNGKQWARFHAGVEEDLFAVWGESLDRIHLAGLSGALVRFEAGRFEQVPSDLRNDLHALCGRVGGPVFAVGSRGAVLRLENGQWSPDPCESEETLAAVVLGEQHVFALTAAGQLLGRPTRGATMPTTSSPSRVAEGS